MFCPNCGTQNAEPVQLCSKCGFSLKSAAAAPKFKGTMILSSPAQLAPTPSPGPVAPTAPGSGGHPGANSPLAATVVGVAPPGLGASPSPAAPQYAPPPQAPVSPLGATMADPRMTPQDAPGAPQQQHGMAGYPPPQPYYPPGQGSPPQGAYPGYPMPGQGYPPPQQPMGQYPGQPYPPQGPAYPPPPGYGHPGQGFPPPGAGAYPGHAQQQGWGAPAFQAPARMPQRRHPLKVLLLPPAIGVGCIIVSAILGVFSETLGALAGLGVLGAVFLSLYWVINMLLELRDYTRDPDFNWWFIFVPFLNWYFAWALLPDQMRRAKGSIQHPTPTRSAIVYFFLLPYALAADLNDLAP